MIQLSEKLKGTYWTLFLITFFNSPALIDKPSEDGFSRSELLPPVGQASKNLINYPYPEKFQPCEFQGPGEVTEMSLLQEWRLKSKKILCSVRHAVFPYAWLQREAVTLLIILLITYLFKNKLFLRRLLVFFLS